MKSCDLVCDPATNTEEKDEEAEEEEEKDDAEEEETLLSQEIAAPFLILEEDSMISAYNTFSERKEKFFYHKLVISYLFGISYK